MTGGAKDVTFYKASDELHAIARRSFDRIALVDGQNGREWSYGELNAAIDRAASHIRQHMEGRNGSLVVILPNSIDCALLFLGAIRAGVDFAPLTPQATQRDVNSWLELAKPALVIHSPMAAPLLEKTSAAKTFATQEIIATGSLDWLSATEVPAQHPSRAATMLLYTSGTTGTPKALAFDCDRLWSSGRAFLAEHDFVDAQSRFWNILPMSYLGGTYNLTMLPLSIGASVVVSDAFSGKSFIGFWSNIERFGINTLWLVPTIVRGLLALEKVGGPRRKTGVRASFLGTSSIDQQTKQAFERAFGFCLVENFALSETTFLTSETVGSRLRKPEGRTGTTLPYVSLRLKADAEHTDEGVGEIEVKTPFLFLGYMQADGSVDLPLSDDGYFRTGDIGKRDADGDLVHLGRTRDIIKKGGYFVVLTELERLALELGHVSEAAAVPVAHAFYGEDSALCLILKPDAPADTAAQVRAHLQTNLPSYKWPSSVQVVAEFPRTASGKVKKALLAQELAARK
jgi:acyl-CoA synthetase (AMP-forming)/AMP-acid ligase II